MVHDSQALTNEGVVRLQFQNRLVLLTRRREVGCTLGFLCAFEILPDLHVHRGLALLRQKGDEEI